MIFFPAEVIQLKYWTCQAKLSRSRLGQYLVMSLRNTFCRKAILSNNSAIGLSLSQFRTSLLARGSESALPVEMLSYWWFLLCLIIIHHGRFDFPKQGELATAVIEAGGIQMETYQENTVYNLVGKVTIYTSLFFFLLSQCLRCFEEKRTGFMPEWRGII